MRRAVLALACTLVIMFLALIMLQVVQANPFTPRFDDQSMPTSFENPYSPNYRIYFDYNIEKSLPPVDAFSYILDYQQRVFLSFEASDINMTIYTPSPPLQVVDGTRYRVLKTFENLADGDHTLQVFAHFSNGTIKTIIDKKIKVDANYVDPLLPVIVSPKNQTTLNSNEVPLVYTTNSAILWSYYSLDNFEMKYFEGNITLPDLSNGLHTLRLSVIYNVTTTDNVQPWMTTTKAQTVTFYVETIAPNSVSPNPTPTVPEISWLVILPLLLSVFSVAVILRHRKTAKLE